MRVPGAAGASARSRAQLLEDGADLVADRARADTIVEVRLGALSIDEDQTLVGIAQMNLPIPLAGQFTLPELALFKERVRRGVAKFAAAGYSAKSGSLLVSAAPEYGFSHEKGWVVLFFLDWTSNDLLPETVDPSSNGGPKPLPSSGSTSPTGSSTR